ncbi:hypothetical protein IJ750_02545 [bacterium]|nr:hypothetical protein [bacterium]
MDNGNELIRAIIDKKIRDSLMAQQQQQSNSNIINRLNGIGNRLDSIGGGFSTAGNYLSNNTPLTGLGAGSQTVGGVLQKGAGAIQNITAPMAAGAATSGAAGGAAMSNPVSALVALGAMALTGANRHRAEKAGQQAEQLANGQMDIAQNQLSQVPQNVINPNDYTPAPIPQTTQAPENIKQSAFSGVASGLDDFLKGYRENKNQSFDWNNLKADSSKGAMQRLGEGAGTIARVAQNPVVQGIIAGGLSGLFSGDPLYGLSSAYKYANSKYKTNMYKDILAQQGVDIGNNNGIFDASDLSKILTARRYQKDYMSRGEYDKFRLDNGQLTIDEYNSLIKNPDYNPEEILNVTGLEQIAKAGKYAQDSKNSRSQNYWRNQNKGQNVIRVEYGERPDTHNYTHVTYGEKPENKSTTYVKYENKPQYTPPKTITKTQSKPSKTTSKPATTSNERVKVKSPDGTVGTIPKNNLLDALKEGYKLIKDARK